MTGTKTENERDASGLLCTEEHTDYEKAALVMLSVQQSEAQAQASFAELERLLSTAGGQVAFRLTQNKQAPDARTCLGSGKVRELSDLCKIHEVKLVVFDCELSPSQIRNIENEMETDVRVIDRSMLILDIFALHAASGEGKLQVELAQLKYTIPRLTGKGSALSRLGGGIGTRGPGETKLETDRRHLQRRIRALEQQIEEMDRNRATQRKQRTRAGLFQFAIAGYTNAGKSTLLNSLTDAGILAEDKLFATLDPTTRKYTLPHGSEILLTDTVGFLRNLPHHLIRAFRSTLDEVSFADAVLIVMDASDPECAAQLEVTQNLMEQLGAADKPKLYVMNKCDLVARESLPLALTREDVAVISAKNGTGLDELTDKMERLVNEGKHACTFLFGYRDQSFIDLLHRDAQVLEIDYREDGVAVCAVCDGKLRGQLAQYLIESQTERD